MWTVRQSSARWKAKRKGTIYEEDERERGFKMRKRMPPHDVELARGLEILLTLYPYWGFMLIPECAGSRMACSDEVI